MITPAASSPRGASASPRGARQFRATVVESPSKSGGLRILTHPDTLEAYYQRMDFMTRHRRVLPPAKTQEFSAEAQRRRRFEDASVHYMQITKSIQRLRETSGSQFAVQLQSRRPNSAMSIHPISSGSSGSESIRSDRKLKHEVENWIREHSHYPTTAAKRMTELRRERLSSSRLSKKLRGAILGHEHDASKEKQGTKNVMTKQNRQRVASIGPAEYFATRELFCDIDEDHSGFLSFSEIWEYRSSHPWRIGNDVLQNLELDPDGRIYFDEFLKIHFPQLTQGSIETAMELYEPRSQDISALSADTKNTIREIFERIHVEYPEPPHPMVSAGGFLERPSTCERSNSGTSESLSPKPNLPPRLSPSLLAVKRKHTLSPTPRSDLLQEGPGKSLSPFSPAREGTASTLAGTPREASFLNSPPPLTLYQLYRAYRARCQLTVVEFIELFYAKDIVLQADLFWVETAATSETSRQLLVRLRKILSRPPSSAGHGVAGTGMTWAERTAFPYEMDDACIEMLRRVYVGLLDFTRLTMEAHYMMASQKEVQPYIPHLHEKLAALTWSRMFPHTGEVKNYFKRPLRARPAKTSP